MAGLGDPSGEKVRKFSLSSDSRLTYPENHLPSPAINIPHVFKLLLV